MPATPGFPKTVADALTAGDATTLQALADGPDKNQRKAAKRALHLLRARGVAIPEKAVSKATPAALSGEAPSEPPLLTAFDGVGERAFFLPLKAATGFTLHVGIVDDADRLIALEAFEFSRRQLRNYFATLPHETRSVAWEATLEEAAAALAPALRNAEGPLGPPARALLAVLPATGAAFPDAATDPSALADTAELFKTDAFAGALPDREAIVQVSQKLHEVTVSPLYVDDLQRMEQLRRLVEQASADYFDRPRREAFARRALVAAQLFDSRDDGANAQRARVLAAALRGDADPLTVPFVRQFFERLLNLEAANALGRQAKAEPAGSPSSLIVPP